MTKRPRDLAASVRQRLLDLARSRSEDFQTLLTRYGLERFLYRLSASPHADEFVLKGAMLFAVWTGEMHRATWDVDLLGRGDAEAGRIRKLFAGVCRARVKDDGVTFDAGSVRAEPIREDQVHDGPRVRVAGRLGVARIQLQIDIGFGDAVRPPPRRLPFPTLLDMPTPVPGRRPLPDHPDAAGREFGHRDRAQARGVGGDGPSLGVALRGGRGAWTSPAARDTDP